MFGHPKKCTSITAEFTAVVSLEIREYLHSGVAIHIGAGSRTIRDAEAKYNLVRLSRKQIVGEIIKQVSSSH
jgi:hypothetical protein